MEDSASDAALIQEFLKASKLPNRVQRVEDGQLALDYLQRRGRYTVAPSPDLILLDLDLPKVDGFGVLREVRDDGQLRNTPVIVVTSRADEEDIRRATHLQASGYLIKPRDVAGYVAVVQEIEEFCLA